MSGEVSGSPPSELFLDDRGHALRVSWHPELGEAIVSIWREDVCVSTVRISGDDLMRLSTMITQAWLDGVRRAATAAQPPA